jgi:hypothetical protein
VLGWAASAGSTPVEAALAVLGGDGRPEGLRDVEADPWLAGQVYERLLAPAARRERGAHFTPRELAAALVDRVLTPWIASGTIPTICDPTMGAGAFLLAAADRLAAAGHTRAVVVGALHGADLDPDAVRVARAALARWADVPEATLASRFVVADSLAQGATGWPEGAAPFDVVLGNPPFLSQLAAATSRSADHHTSARELLAGRAVGYADTAGLFLLRGVGLTRPGGMTAMLQPLSLLATRDAGPVRAALADAGVTEVWVGGDGGFEASVRVCAPIVAPGAASDGQVVVLAGPSVSEVCRVPLPADRSAPWGELAAVVAGVPQVRLRSRGTVGDLATATAGFRDLFYALAAAVRPAEGPDDLPVLTAGLIDPLASRWATADTRLGGVRLRRPAVPRSAVAALPGRLPGWVEARLVPKLLVATQTRVLEVLPDPDGRLVPCTPVISLEPRSAEDLWRLAAALTAPPVTAWCARLTAGTALGGDAIKPSARQLLHIPLPEDRGTWEEGAVLARKAAEAGSGSAGRRELLAQLGTVMCRAYGVRDEGLVAWWRGRLPERA